MTRCHALTCDDPTGGPEPTASLHGMPAHPGCVEDDPEGELGNYDACPGCGDHAPANLHQPCCSLEALRRANGGPVVSNETPEKILPPSP